MELTLAQLTRRAGVSARTVRYYIQRGLLPAPPFRGPDTCYGEAHLLGLKAIRALQEAYWPLDAIAVRLQGCSNGELRAIAADAGLSAPAAAIRAAPLAQSEREAAPARGTRIALAPGLELWLDDAASGAVRDLAGAIERLAAVHASEVIDD